MNVLPAAVNGRSNFILSLLLGRVIDPSQVKANFKRMSGYRRMAVTDAT
jgi:hypothetical protein